jgi:hypothetical protein
MGDSVVPRPPHGARALRKLTGTINDKLLLRVHQRQLREEKNRDVQY